ncbi:DnaB helicase C-terminal domain-containing protein, partial [Sporobacter termitidis]|uniref:DnaB helicase C-terminal domain-containing protein n=1 Tax=Sporobacter termitidis TaxID=44749 RepID=UPI001FA922FE
ESEATKDKRPQLHNLRDSGDIEQDADGVMLMYRPGYYKREEAAPQWGADELEIIVAKNRHGNTGTAMFAWYGVSGKSIPRED